MKMFLRNLLVWLARCLGSTVRDVRTGRVLGRALFVPWKGGIRVLGAEAAWVPVPVSQSRITYWRQDLGFTLHDSPPTLRSPSAAAALAASPFASLPVHPLIVVLDHRSPEAVSRHLERWTSRGASRDTLLLVYGGPEASFAAIDWPHKRFLSDPRLRTRDHQRDRQSYRCVLREVSDWMQGRDFTHVLFMEYDQIPLAADVPALYLHRLSETDADVLGYDVQRIDGTLHPHWLGLMDQTLPPPPVWSLLGTGHFWKREAWEAVTAEERHAGWYLELDFASTAVELGFRLAGLPDQDPYVQALPEQLPCTPDLAAQRGAWTLHPVKAPLR
jgi:hypothetical protein